MDTSALTPARVLAIRTALNLTQERLAQLLGVSWTTVNRWEAGSSAPTGMPARLLHLLDEAAENGRFRAALRDARSGDPLFTLYRLLSGVYNSRSRPVSRRR